MIVFHIPALLNWLIHVQWKCLIYSFYLFQPCWAEEVVWNFHEDVCRPTQQGTFVCRFQAPEHTYTTHTHTHTHFCKTYTSMNSCITQNRLTVSDSASPTAVFSPQTQIHTLRHVQCTLTLGLKTVANRMVWFEWISDFRQFARLFSTTVTPDVQTSSVAFLPFLLALMHSHTGTLTIPPKRRTS